jgi:hypothetical protein
VFSLSGCTEKGFGMMDAPITEVIPIYTDKDGRMRVM